MEHKKLVSVIIPTYNRKEILLKSLIALHTQKDFEPEGMEVIIVDDGSFDGTQDMVEKERGQFLYTLIFLRQSHQGQGVAKNIGLNQASGYIVLFIGDDIVLDPSCIAEHLSVHKKYREDHVACLGYVTWDKYISQTPFLYFLEHGGPQFNYPKLEKTGKILDGELRLRSATFWYFYTSNISLKRDFLRGERFDKAYTSYGWEDIDFGYHLWKDKGMQLLYNRRAIGYHDHCISEDSFKARMVSIGKNALLFHQRHPAVGVIPQGFKKMFFRIIAAPVSLFFLKMVGKLIPPAQWWYFYALSKRYFLEGLKGV